MVRHRLARDVAALTVLKLAVLALIFVIFFAPSHRPALDPVTHIAGPAPAHMDPAHGRR